MTKLAFIDFETRSTADITKVGAYKYARDPSTDVLVLGWAFEGEGQAWSPRGYLKKTLSYCLDDLFECLDTGYVVAWNAFFDRHIWNEVLVKRYDFPPLDPEQVLCAMAQAEANNLPGNLAKAAETLGVAHQKQKEGAKLIRQLCTGTRATWTPGLANLMDKFRSYCVDDVLAMRDIWQCTRPLTLNEWQEYHASEQINDNGCAVDVEFAHAAAQFLTVENADLNQQLRELTGDKFMTVNAHTRKAKYLHDLLEPDRPLQIITERDAKNGKARFSANRQTREFVLEGISSPEHETLFDTAHKDSLVKFLELVDAGNSAAARKFEAIGNYAISGRVRGQYSFNGAGQTGRFSSRGIQIHNLIRDPVTKDDPDRAIEAMEDILNGTTPDDLVETYGFPISRLLARLVRPTFTAGPGKLLVWADYDQIEARVLPWLSLSAGGEYRLDAFRKGVDLYEQTARTLFGLSATEKVSTDQRHIGKISELALGFGGAGGAFKAMARNFGLALSEQQVDEIVRLWRDTNQWCVTFWYALWDAAMAAYIYPGNWYGAGRVRYLFHEELMHGTLICSLPDGRWLVYPQFQQHEDEDTGRTRTTYMKSFGGGSGRVDLWHGKLAENITQASAASFLRGALVDVSDLCVLHTHDEIVVECNENEIELASVRLQEAMLYEYEWAEGLPLSVSVDSGPFYTK